MSDITSGDIPATVESVTSKHIVGCVSASISDDGSTAMIVFEVAGRGGAQDEKFALTISAGQVDWFRTIGHHLVLQKARHGVGQAKVYQPSINVTGAEDILIGTTEDPRMSGRVVFTMNPGIAEEMCYQVTYFTAAKLAAMINRVTLPKMSPEERKELREYELTIKPKIILPGG